MGAGKYPGGSLYFSFQGSPMLLPGENQACRKVGFAVHLPGDYIGICQGGTMLRKDRDAYKIIMK